MKQRRIPGRRPGAWHLGPGFLGTSIESRDLVTIVGHPSLDLVERCLAVSDCAPTRNRQPRP